MFVKILYACSNFINSWLVFHQSFQTLENNRIHSTVHQAIIIVLLKLQNIQDNKNNSAIPASCFHCLSCFTNSGDQ